MAAECNTELYLRVMVQAGLYRRKDNLKFYTDILFADVDFKAKRVLDVGGGSGLLSFFAACKGASKVICLEPELEGSTKGVQNKFKHAKSMLGLDNVYLEPTTFQDFDSGDTLFDVILLHNSINHLDENACIHLLENDQSKAVYNEIFQKLASMSAKGATLIICDCSNKNFYARLGIRNPLAPQIEWHKHQAPEVWAKMLEAFGFKNPKISWLSYNSLRRFGRILAGNRVVTYFLTSHFCLVMYKA